MLIKTKERTVSMYVEFKNSKVNSLTFLNPILYPDSVLFGSYLRKNNISKIFEKPLGCTTGQTAATKDILFQEVNFLDYCFHLNEGTYELIRGEIYRMIIMLSSVSSFYIPGVILDFDSLERQVITTKRNSLPLLLD